MTPNCQPKMGSFFLMVETVQAFDGCEQYAGQSLGCTVFGGISYHPVVDIETSSLKTNMDSHI